MRPAWSWVTANSWRPVAVFAVASVGERVWEPAVLLMFPAAVAMAQSIRFERSEPQHDLRLLRAAIILCIVTTGAFITLGIGLDMHWTNLVPPISAVLLAAIMLNRTRSPNLR